MLYEIIKREYRPRALQNPVFKVKKLKTSLNILRLSYLSLSFTNISYQKIDLIA